jgi:hypothetical protein
MLGTAWLLFSLLLTNARALGVEEAYRAIPHQRTVFDRSLAVKDGMSAADASSLDALFRLVDEAIVAKVEVSSDKPGPESVRLKYDSMIAKANALEADGAIRGARDLVVRALADHRDYLAGGQRPLIQRSSGYLHQAYQLLIDGFPKQKGSVRQSFFDYLCALDFI